MQQLIFTPAMGKRLIGQATAGHPAVLRALQKGTVVVLAGTTNGFVAEEILESIDQADNFSRANFFRGLVLPPGWSKRDLGIGDGSGFPGDVVVVDGEWQPRKTIFDVADDLREGDVVIKGGNALDLVHKQAGVLIGHPQAGTIGAALQAVIGRRVNLILPVGLEKRVGRDLNHLAGLLNKPGGQGPRLFPVPGGEVISELEALTMICGVQAELVAGGGIGGAEGAVWLAVTGTEEQEQKANELSRILAEKADSDPVAP